MDQPVYAVFKNKEKQRDYPGFAQACADWSNDPNGRKVVKLDDDGNIVEEFDSEECQQAAEIYRKSISENTSAPAQIHRLDGGEGGILSPSSKSA